MTRNKCLMAICLAASLTTFAGAALAASGDWIVRLRGINVSPDEDASVNIGGDISADSAYMPEIDFTYFLTDNIAAELIAATSEHEFRHSTAGNLGDAWVLPPTLTLQYHFMPEEQFSPYLGAGVNYTAVYGESAENGFFDFDAEGDYGWVLQGGFDYWLDDNWGINLDVKKIFVDVNATLNNGAVRADIELDPWVFGAGIAYKF